MARLVIACAVMIAWGSAGCGSRELIVDDRDGGADAGEEAGAATAQVLADFADSIDDFSFVYDERPANIHVLNGGAAPTLLWSASEGDPNRGSLQVTAQYLFDGRYIDGRYVRLEGRVRDAFDRRPESWRGRTLSVRFKVAVGLDSTPDFSGNATLYVSAGETTGIVERSDATVGIAPGSQWQTVTHVVRNDAFSAPIDAFGLIFELQRGGFEAPNTPDPAPSVFYVDTFTRE